MLKEFSRRRRSHQSDRETRGAKDVNPDEIILLIKISPASLPLAENVAMQAKARS